MTSRFLISAIFLIVAGAFTQVQADGSLPKPVGNVILDLSGNLQNSNTTEGHAQFDLAMLKGMPAIDVKTGTPWYDGIQKLTGVRIRDLLRAAGATGTTIEAIALNNYMVTIPVAETMDTDVIIAYAFDDKPMSVRDKGPLWVIYPLTDHPSLDVPDIHAKMIWQLKAMTIQ